MPLRICFVFFSPSRSWGPLLVYFGSGGAHEPLRMELDAVWCWDACIRSRCTPHKGWEPGVGVTGGWTAELAEGCGSKARHWNTLLIDFFLKKAGFLSPSSSQKLSSLYIKALVTCVWYAKSESVQAIVIHGLKGSHASSIKVGHSLCSAAIKLLLFCF